MTNVFFQFWDFIGSKFDIFDEGRPNSMESVTKFYRSLVALMARILDFQTCLILLLRNKSVSRETLLVNFTLESLNSFSQRNVLLASYT